MKIYFYCIALVLLFSGNCLATINNIYFPAIDSYEVEIYDVPLIVTKTEAILIAKGNMAYQNGDYDEAIKKFEEICKDNPCSVKYLLLADAYFKREKYVKAEKNYKLVLSDPSQFRKNIYFMANFQLSKIMVVRENFASVIEYTKEAIKYASEIKKRDEIADGEFYISEPELYIMLSKVYFLEKNKVKANEAVEKAYKKVSQYNFIIPGVDYYYLFSVEGDLLFTKKELLEAEKVFRKAYIFSTNEAEKNYLSVSIEKCKSGRKK